MSAGARVVRPVWIEPGAGWHLYHSAQKSVVKLRDCETGATRIEEAHGGPLGNATVGRIFGVEAANLPAPDLSRTASRSKNPAGCAACPLAGG